MQAALRAEMKDKTNEVEGKKGENGERRNGKNVESSEMNRSEVQRTI